WIFTLVAFIGNSSLGLTIFTYSFHIGKEGLKLPKGIIHLWMVPWAVTSLFIAVTCFWLPPTLSDHYHTLVFNQGCANRGWDLDITLHSAAGYSSATFAPIVRNASTYPNDNYTVQLFRHLYNPFLFDFLPFTTAPGSTPPPFSNITYDWQNATYIAFRPD